MLFKANINLTGLHHHNHEYSMVQCFSLVSTPILLALSQQNIMWLLLLKLELSRQSKDELILM